MFKTLGKWKDFLFIGTEIHLSKMFFSVRAKIVENIHICVYSIYRYTFVKIFDAMQWYVTAQVLKVANKNSVLVWTRKLYISFDLFFIVRIEKLIYESRKDPIKQRMTPT